MSKNITKSIGLASTVAVLTAAGFIQSNNVFADDANKSDTNSAAQVKNSTGQTIDAVKDRVNQAQAQLDKDQVAADQNNQELSATKENRQQGQAANQQATNDQQTATDSQNQVVTQQQTVAAAQEKVNQAQNTADNTPKTATLSLATAQQNLDKAKQTLADLQTQLQNTQTKNAQNDSQRAALTAKIQTQEKIVNQLQQKQDAETTAEAASHQDAAGQAEKVQSAKQAVTDAQSQLDAANQAVTTAQANVPATAQAHDTKGSLDPTSTTDYPDSMYIQTTAQLPTSITDPMAGETNPNRTDISNFYQYGTRFDNNTAADDHTEQVDPYHITAAQNDEIADYTAMLVNNYRQSIGLNPVQLTVQGQQNVVTYIQNFRNTYNIPWDHTPHFDVNTGTAISKSDGQALINNTLAFSDKIQQQGFTWLGENLGMVTSASNHSTYSMTEVKTSILQMVTAMIYDDEGSNNGHKANFENKNATYMSVSLNPMHDKATQESVGSVAEPMDVVVEMLSAGKGKTAADYTPIDSTGNATKIINDARAAYGPTADQLQAQKTAEANLAQAKSNYQALIGTTTAPIQADDDTSTQLAAAQQTLQQLKDALNGVPTNKDTTDLSNQITKAQQAVQEAQNALENTGEVTNPDYTAALKALNDAQNELKKQTDLYKNAQVVAQQAVTTAEESSKKVVDLTALNNKVAELTKTGQALVVAIAADKADLAEKQGTLAALEAVQKQLNEQPSNSKSNNDTESTPSTSAATSQLAANGQSSTSAATSQSAVSGQATMGAANQPRDVVKSRTDRFNVEPALPNTAAKSVKDVLSLGLLSAITAVAGIITFNHKKN